MSARTRDPAAQLTLLSSTSSPPMARKPTLRPKPKPRRPRGTGTVFIKGDRWYGQWYTRGRLTKRSIGPVRQPATAEGLTKTQAEARLRLMITEAGAAPPPIAERVTVGEAGARLIRQLGVRGRKSSTTGNYESYLRVHLEPYFGDKALIEITAEDVEDFIQLSLDNGLAVKSTLNHLGFLHGIFEFAIRKRWAHLNPCDRAEKPGLPGHDEEIRFLDQEELEALYAALGTDRSPHKPATIERAARVRQLRDIEGKPWSVIASEVGCAESTAIYLYRCDPELRIDDDIARVERALYLTAAMTGLRQGELLALRWADVDQPARRVRVRRNFVRGEFGTPKSRRSSRSVPLADRVAAALAELRDASAYAADDDLMFGHPHTGKPLDRSLLLKRFKRALKQAGVREIRFHDLRHTFGTRMAAAGVPIRTLQEWMGHRDYKTTLIYADYAPSPNEAQVVNAAFSPPALRDRPASDVASAE